MTTEPNDEYVVEELTPEELEELQKTRQPSCQDGDAAGWGDGEETE